MTERRVLRIAPGGTTGRVGSGFHSQVDHAAARLSAGLRTWCDVPLDAEILAGVQTPPVPGLGDEGYAIRSSLPARIEIAANSDAGAANGIYGLLMRIRTEQIRAPFSATWDSVSTPRWPDRRVGVASYAMGMTKMTPDMWTFDEWKTYIDFVRGFNVNRLSILGLFPYHPEVPSTHKGKWRLEVQRQAIAYAHEQGMKVNVMAAYNHVPTQVFWDHPELRTDALRGYFGLALCWSKAKDVIMKYHRYSLDFLEGLDGIEIMVTEPLGWCLCERCRPDTAAVWLDAVREIGGALKERNPEGEVVFWNWLSGFFGALRGIYPPTTAIENVDEIQDQLLRGMPSDVVFMDLSVNQLTKDQEFGPRLTRSDSIEILEVAAKRGFRSRNFFFYMDKEFGMLDRLSLFPKPYLDHTIDEFEYTGRLPASGVCSYRLAPPGRFLSDFAFMRMAWDPAVAREQLVDAAAGYLTSTAEDRRTVAQGIERIESYWHRRDRGDLLAARDAFESACGNDPSEELVRVRDGLVILAMIDEYARSAKDVEAALEAGGGARALMKVRDDKLLDVYQTLKEYPIYQGLTTDGIWEPRAIAMLLRPRMEMWARTLNHKGYYE